MKLSIIVPIYKVEDYIIRCMEGILHQDLDDYEVIAVDDGSPDRSIEILQAYLNEHPAEAARVQIIRKENGGLSDARNAGLAVATGEYIWFVDSDDTIAENCLSRLYETASRDRLDLMLFDEQNIDCRDGQCVERTEEYRDGRIQDIVQSGIDLFIELRSKRLYYCSAAGYWMRRGMLAENSLTFYKGIHHEDELFTPQAMHHAVRARYIGEHPYIRYIRRGSITSGENIDQLVQGYGTVVIELMAFMDAHVTNALERHYLEEDITDLAQILIGESSLRASVSQNAQEVMQHVERQLRCHGLRLGIPFRLYVMKNQLMNRDK